MKSITKQKGFFFFKRAFFSFCLLGLPFILGSLPRVSKTGQFFLLILYFFFQVSQWYLMGKELDHRFKIYYKVYSSIDRLIYRLFFGYITFVLFFGFFALFPVDFQHYFFWFWWIGLSLFYSWPTRGKIIQETFSKQLGEFRFLDSFEKTLLFLVIIFFLISIPDYPRLESLEAFKLALDPVRKVHTHLWRYLSFNYLPYSRLPGMQQLAWSFHLYTTGLGFFLLAFYGILRIFFSRRLAVLGAFCLISSWSVSKTLEYDFGSVFMTTFCAYWIWGILWVIKSDTYRTGLFSGFLLCFSSWLSASYFFLFPFQVAIILIGFKHKTSWFKLQFFKYYLVGFCLALFFLLGGSHFSLNPWQLEPFKNELVSLFLRKSFFSLSLLGLAYLAISLSKKMLFFLQDKFLEFFLCFFVCLLFSFTIEQSLLSKFSLMMLLAFFSIFPLRFIFDQFYSLRSRRNILFAFYILICLLDSHAEGRVKILINLLH